MTGPASGDWPGQEGSEEQPTPGTHIAGLAMAAHGVIRLRCMWHLLVAIGTLWIAKAARAEGRDQAFAHNRRRRGPA